jgi:hypothetical protein
LTANAGAVSALALTWLFRSTASAQVTIAFFGDQGAGASATAVLQLIADEGADAVFHLGDFDYEDDPGAWDQRITSVLGPNYPYFVAVGNHDEGHFYGAGGYQEKAAARMIANGISWTGDLGNASWHVWNDIFFVATGPDIFGSGDGVYAPFIQAALSGPAQPYAWRLSGWHVLMRNMQVGGKSDQSGWNVYERSREGGAIICTAHEHSYARTNLLSDISAQTVVDTDGDYVISEGQTIAFHSGLGGHSIRDQERCFPTISPYGCDGTWSAIYAEQQGATYGALFITFGYGGDPCRARGRFKAVDGQVVDEFFLTSNVGPCADPCQVTCELDFDCDGIIGFSDLLEVLIGWGNPWSIEDLLLILLEWGGDGCPDLPPPDTIGVWLTQEEIAQRPTSGVAWNALSAAARTVVGPPDISDQDNDADVYALAKALVASRTGDPALAAQARDLIAAAMGTEDGGSTLALGRNLLSYVIAADLVGSPPGFREWLADVIHEQMKDERTLIQTQIERPNNWGTHAAASLAATAVFLEDKALLDQVTTIFRGYLGDREAYAGFVYGDLCWQADPAAPVGINPPGAVVDGINADGVLPDDQRRAGCPPEIDCGFYGWEGLQGAVAAAWILSRQGFDAFGAQDQALLRALFWQYVTGDCPASGDDLWQPHLVNRAYGLYSFPETVPAGHGKNVGWTDWTH